MKSTSQIVLIFICLALTLCSHAAEIGATAPMVIENTVGMTFQLIPQATFSMGSETGEPDERPVHDVQLSAFYMSVFEVTQGQYEQVMGINPSEYGDPEHPVIRVSWYDAVAFCQRLSELDGATYRLPTEAEWEYAARAGHPGWEYVWGDAHLPMSDGAAMANVGDDRFIATYPSLIGRFGTAFSGYDDGFEDLAHVGSFPANGFGLHDMGGNVLEWCLDVYGLQYYNQSPLLNPTGPETGSDRVMRGASWLAGRKYARVSGRFRDLPELVAASIGFRCVLEIAEVHAEETN